MGMAWGYYGVIYIKIGGDHHFLYFVPISNRTELVRFEHNLDHPPPWGKSSKGKFTYNAKTNFQFSNSTYFVPINSSVELVRFEHIPHIVLPFLALG